MNILVLTGSPRKGGNSDKMADAFIAGARQAGHEATKYTAADKRIKACIACDRCYSMGEACAVDDDFNGLAPLAEKADMIVFATPVYWFTFPAQLKTALDKFHSFLVGNRGIRGKDCALLACAASPSEEYLEGIAATYKLIARYLGWTDKGIVAIPGVVGKGDIEKTDGLARAEALGKSIAEKRS